MNNLNPLSSNILCISNISFGIYILFILNFKFIIFIYNKYLHKDTKIISYYKMIITKYLLFNESIKSLLVGPTIEEIINMINELPPYEMLIKSAEFGFLDGVKKSLQNGVTEIGKNRAFNYACNEGNFEIADYLLEHGADINYLNGTTLMDSILLNKYDMLIYLLKKGANTKIINQLPELFLRKDINDDIKKIIKKIINTNESIKSLLVGPTQEEVWESIKELPPRKMIIRSASINFLDGVKTALEKGVSQSIKNMSFNFACNNENFEIADYLLEHGADIDYLNGLTLRDAIDYNKYDMLVYLLEHGANVHISNNKPLLIARIRGNDDIIKLVKKYMNKND